MADWGYTYLATEQDRLWYDEGLRRGWALPAPASLIWRIWGVRHVRAVAHEMKAHWDFEPSAANWRALWSAEWVAYAISRGWV